MPNTIMTTILWVQLVGFLSAGVMGTYDKTVAGTRKLKYQKRSDLIKHCTETMAPIYKKPSQYMSCCKAETGQPPYMVDENCIG